MKKYKDGEIINSLDELIKQEAVFQYIEGGDSNHWKYMNIGWVLSYQLNYVAGQIAQGNFAYVIKIKEE